MTHVLMTFRTRSIHVIYLKEIKKKMAHLYILRCADDSLYVGSTDDLETRLKRHKSGYAADYTKLHAPVELIYTEEYPTYKEAFNRERQLHKWSRAKKDALIAGDIEKLKELSKSKNK